MSSTFAVTQHLHSRFELLLTKKPLFKCPLSVIERCPSNREFKYSKINEERLGPTSDVRLIQVSVKRELTVDQYCSDFNIHIGKDACLDNKTIAAATTIYLVSSSFIDVSLSFYS